MLDLSVLVGYVLRALITARSLFSLWLSIFCLSPCLSLPHGLGYCVHPFFGLPIFLSWSQSIFDILFRCCSPSRLSCVFFLWSQGGEITHPNMPVGRGYKVMWEPHTLSWPSEAERQRAQQTRGQNRRISHEWAWDRVWKSLSHITRSNCDIPTLPQHNARTRPHTSSYSSPWQNREIGSEHVFLFCTKRHHYTFTLLCTSHYNLNAIATI